MGINTLKTLAVIPARGGSKRLPGKNVRPFLGTPLIEWSVRFATTYRRIDKLVVSTDSQMIAGMARAAGATLPKTLRPAELATDQASTADAVIHVVNEELLDGNTYDVLALLQPTSPMRLCERWDAAFAALHRGFDAAIGVAPVRHHSYHSFSMTADGSLAPFLKDGLKLRSQDLPPSVFVCGCLYLIRIEALLEGRTFFPERTAGILVNQPFESVDLDDEADWVQAEALGRHFKCTLPGLDP